MTKPMMNMIEMMTTVIQDHSFVILMIIVIPSRGVLGHWGTGNIPSGPLKIYLNVGPT